MRNIQDQPMYSPYPYTSTHTPASISSAFNIINHLHLTSTSTPTTATSTSTPPSSPTSKRIPANSFVHTLYPELVREPIPLSPLSTPSSSSSPSTSSLSHSRPATTTTTTRSPSCSPSSPSSLSPSTPASNSSSSLSSRTTRTTTRAKSPSSSPASLSPTTPTRPPSHPFPPPSSSSSSTAQYSNASANARTRTSSPLPNNTPSIAYNTPTHFPASQTTLSLDPHFSEAPKCHITDFVVSLFHQVEQSAQECTFQLFASRCWAMRRKLDSHYTSLRAQAFLDTLQQLNHPHIAAPTAHFSSSGYYYAVYPLYSPLLGLSRRDKHQLWEGLCALHNVGLRHGDVTLRNVLRDEKGNVVWLLAETAMHETEMNSTTNDMVQFEKNIAGAPERKDEAWTIQEVSSTLAALANSIPPTPSTLPTPSSSMSISTPSTASPVPLESDAERNKRKRADWEDREREERAKEQWARGEWCRDGVKVDMMVHDKRPVWTSL